MRHPVRAVTRSSIPVLAVACTLAIPPGEPHAEQGHVDLPQEREPQGTTALVDPPIRRYRAIGS
jgi:hypothetical protein